MIKLVVLDMAGTTIDEDNMVYKCMVEAFEAHHLNVSLDTMLMLAAGKDKISAIREVYTILKSEIPDDRVVQALYESFSAKLTVAYETMELKLMNGVRQLLKFLRDRGIISVFNTGYTEKVARTILEKVDLEVGRDLDMLVTTDQVTHCRPAPDMILLALSAYQIDASNCIKIGDSKVDIEEGKRANVKYSIGITTGAQTEEVLKEANPDFVIHDLLDLIPIIEKANVAK